MAKRSKIRHDGSGAARNHAWHIYAAITAGVVAAAAASLMWAFHPATTDGGDHERTTVKMLDALRNGNCLFLSGDTWSVPVLDLSLLPADVQRPLIGLKCPVVLQHPGERASIHELQGWASWKTLRAALLPTREAAQRPVTYDLSPRGSPLFLYWDNATALAGDVRRRGVAQQTYLKTRGAASKFLDQALHPSRYAGLPVRYGSRLREFSTPLSQTLGLVHDGTAGRLRCLSAAHEDTAEAAHSSADVGLWISQRGVTSAMHYDLWDNTHLVLAGSKAITLSRPSLGSLRSWSTRPSAHPHARQARHSAASVEGGARAAGQGTPGRPMAVGSDAPMTSLADETARRRVDISAGEALFIPAGWLHEVEASGDEAAAALSITAYGRELADFRELVADINALAPFMATWRTFEPTRLASALRVFLPALVHGLGIDAMQLRATLSAQYGEATRHEAGLSADLPGAAGADAAPLCTPPPSSRAERTALVRAALPVASRLGQYPHAVQPHYLLVYLEALISKVGGSGSAPEVLGRAFAWVEACGDALWMLEDAEMGAEPKAEGMRR